MARSNSASGLLTVTIMRTEPQPRDFGLAAYHVESGPLEDAGECPEVAGVAVLVAEDPILCSPEQVCIQ